jgi:hypothetical protein
VARGKVEEAKEDGIDHPARILLTPAYRWSSRPFQYEDTTMISQAFSILCCSPFQKIDKSKAVVSHCYFCCLCNTVNDKKQATHGPCTSMESPSQACRCPRALGAHSSSRQGLLLRCCCRVCGTWALLEVAAAKGRGRILWCNLLFISYF